VKPAFHNKYYNGFTTDELSASAPEEIRTPDPQIRSLVFRGFGAAPLGV